MATTDDEDEWEYEYDETETEDFYVQLDLSEVPGEQVPMISMGRQGHPTLLKSRLRALNAQLAQPSDVTADDSVIANDIATMGELQLVGLDTANPLIMYNGQLLSCHWASTIGTDMFFVKPDPGADTTTLRSLPSVDLLGIGSAKLIAKVGRLRPRDELFDDDSNGNTSTEPIDLTSSSANPETTAASLESAGEKQSVPRGFLAKLNEAKAKRGEKTRLVISKTSDGSRVVSENVVKRSGPQNGAPSSRTNGIAMRERSDPSNGASFTPINAISTLPQNGSSSPLSHDIVMGGT